MELCCLAAAACRDPDRKPEEDCVWRPGVEPLRTELQPSVLLGDESSPCLQDDNADTGNLDEAVVDGVEGTEGVVAALAL